MKNTQVRPIFLTLLLTIFLCTCVRAQWSRPENLGREVKKALRSLDKNPGYYSQHVGYSGSASSQYVAFLQLRKYASTETLTRLTSDRNPTVRAYAYSALSEIDGSQLVQIAMQHLADTARIETLNGCIGGSAMVGDQMFDLLHSSSQLPRSAWKKLLNDTLLFFTDYPICFDNNLASVHNIKFFIPLLDNQKHPSLTAAVLRRLETEDNPHVYKPLLREVLKDASSETKAAVGGIYRRNQAMRTGWAKEETKEILREGGVGK
jgi:hypothetical protein